MTTTEPTPEAVEELALVIDPDVFDPDRPKSRQVAAMIQWAARRHMAMEAARKVLAAGYVLRDEAYGEATKAILAAAPSRNAELDPRTGQEDPGMAAYVEGFHDAWSAVVDLRRREDCKPTDSAPLPEDVTMHCLGPFETHADGRICGYHNRLGKWTFDAASECLREHKP